MKTFTCNMFTGHWPVGTAAVVHAYDAAHAAILLNHSLKESGLEGDAKVEDIVEFPESEAVRVLCDGNY